MLNNITTSDMLDGRVSQISEMKFDTAASETELELLRKTWNKFKSELLENHPVHLVSAIQSLFMLELSSHPLNNNCDNDLGLSSYELQNVDMFLVRFEDYCIPRILLKFERFKSLILQHGHGGCGLSHQINANGKCMGQIENSSASRAKKEANYFVSQQKLMPAMEMFENSGTTHEKEVNPDFVISKMSQSEQVSLDVCPEITQESSVTRKQIMRSSEMKNENIKKYVNPSGQKSHNLPEVLIEKKNYLSNSFVNGVIKSDAGLTKNGSSPNDCFSSKSEILSCQEGTNQAVNRRSRRSSKQILRPVCGFQYQNTRLLKEHIKSHTDDDKQKCTFCKALFKQRNNTQPHLLICLCGQNNSNSKEIISESCVISDSETKQVTKCIISDSLTKQQTTPQHVGDKQQPRHRTSECMLPLNCRRSYKTCSVKSDSRSHLKTRPKQFKCEICQDRFRGLAKLKRHKLIHSGEKPYKCNVCGTAFADKSHLNVHVRSHSGEKPFKCDICESSFSESTKLKNHKRIHTGEKTYVCEICGSSFSVSSSLRSHLKIHSDKRPFKCNICDFASVHSSNLKAHLVIHTGEKKFVCDKCGASFTETAKLKRHKMVHTGERPYSCDVCGARFADNSHLTVHMRIHSGEKPFKCTFCDSAFVESSKLKNHVRTHTGEKPYVCEICGMSFAVSYSLKSHMRRHTGEKPYKCDICEYATSQSSNLKTHMVVHTGARSHVCEMCGASFSEMSKLSRHKVIHLDQKEANVENPQQNKDELNSLPPELFYNFSTGSDGIITL